METFKSIIRRVLKEYKDTGKTFRCGHQDVSPGDAFKAISWLYAKGMLDGDMIECRTNFDGFLKANKKHVYDSSVSGTGVDASVYGWYKMGREGLMVWWCWDNPCFKGKTFRSVFNEYNVYHFDSFDKENHDHHRNKYCVSASMTVSLLVRLACAMVGRPLV